MISYAAFWFVPLLSTLTTPVSAACNSAVTCFCGSSHNTYTLCIDDVKDKDKPCNVWSHCKTCQENKPHCASCHENRAGPTCLEVKQIRKKRQYVPSNHGFPGRLFADGDISYVKQIRKKRQRVLSNQANPGRLYTEKYISPGTSSCPPLERPDFASLSCQETNNLNSCTGRCLPGYFFGDSAQDQMKLDCSNGVWTPHQTFPPCRSGSIECTTDMDGTSCDIICNGMHQGQYHCFSGRKWTPSLPYCATPKEGSGSNSARPPSPCSCQNNGFCDSIGDCVCPMGWTGTYCDRRVREETPSCPDPGFPSGGDRVTEDGSPSPFPRSFREGESVVFSCRGRDTALQGVSLIRCRADGTWSAARPLCVRDPSVVCPDPGIVNNADRINTDESPSTPDHVYTPGQSVVYNCRSGYRLRGMSIRTCRHTGQWSGSAPPICSRIGMTPGRPNEKSCRHPEPNINGFIVDDPPRRLRYPAATQLTFGCVEGYRPVGAIMLYCLPTGDWTSQPPTCEETSSVETDSENQRRNCPNLGPVTDGSFSVIGNLDEDDEPQDDDSDFPPGTNLRYTCKDRFLIIGSNILACSTAGDWNTEAPFCVEDCGRSQRRTSHKLTNASRTEPGEWPWMVA